MKRTVVYDLARLFLGPTSRTPRGIDRVDLFLARYFCCDPETYFLGVVPTLMGMQVIGAERVRRGLDRVEALWAETIRPADDPHLQQLVNLLTGVQGPACIPLESKLSLKQKFARLLSLHAAVGFAPGAPARTGIARGAVYLSAGHYSLAYPFLMRWLDRRSDIVRVLMLHDVIPLETPALVSPELNRFQARIVNSVARHGDGLIVSSAYARETVQAALAVAGRSSIPTFAARLPLADVFDAPAEDLVKLANVRYFVVCGAIEPRKNHWIILNIWRQLCANLSDPPHLVVVGTPGWGSQPALDLLHRDEVIRRRVHHVVGLSTPALKSLLAGACGLLMPSLAEGFGLPIIEAEHLGVPVVASDIPAHREVAGASAILLDPFNGPAWREAILALGTTVGQRTGPRPTEKARAERAVYGAAVAEFMDRLATNADRRREIPSRRFPAPSAASFSG